MLKCLSDLRINFDNYSPVSNCLPEHAVFKIPFSQKCYFATSWWYATMWYTRWYDISCIFSQGPIKVFFGMSSEEATILIDRKLEREIKCIGFQPRPNEYTNVVAIIYCGNVHIKKTVTCFDGNSVISQISSYLFY